MPSVATDPAFEQGGGRNDAPVPFGSNDYMPAEVDAFIGWLTNGSTMKAQRLGLTQADLADMYRQMNPAPAVLRFGEAIQGDSNLRGVEA